MLMYHSTSIMRNGMGDLQAATCELSAEDCLLPTENC